MHHVNGDEADGSRCNLAWACRPCNVRIGNVMRAAGIGRRTRQRNPAAKGAESVELWGLAVSRLHDEHDELTLPEAVAIVRATPPEKRSEFAREIWRIRRERYGSSGRYDPVPF